MTERQAADMPLNKHEKVTLAYAWFARGFMICTLLTAYSSMLTFERRILAVLTFASCGIFLQLCAVLNETRLLTRWQKILHVAKTVNAGASGPARGHTQASNNLSSARDATKSKESPKK